MDPVLRHYRPMETASGAAGHLDDVHRVVHFTRRHVRDCARHARDKSKHRAARLLRGRRGETLRHTLLDPVLTHLAHRAIQDLPRECLTNLARRIPIDRHHRLGVRPHTRLLHEDAPQLRDGQRLDRVRLVHDDDERLPFCGLNAGPEEDQDTHRCNWQSHRCRGALQQGTPQKKKTAAVAKPLNDFRSSSDRMKGRTNGTDR